MTAPTHSLDSYRKLLSKCLQARLAVDKFESYFNQLHARSPVAPSAIASTLVEPGLTGNAPDPLHLQYVDRLVAREVVSLAAVLVALLNASAAKAPASSPEAMFHDDGLRGRESLEQDIFLVLTHILRSQKPRSSDNVWAAVQAMSDWMEAVMRVSGAGMMNDSNGSAEGIAEAALAADIPTKGRLEALGGMVVALGDNEVAVKCLQEPGRKDKKLAFQSSLSLFAPYIQPQNPQLANKLEMLKQQFQTQTPRQQRAGMKAGAAAGETIDGMMMGLGGEGTVTMGPVAWTRAHLFVWLDSLLCGRPQVDDSTVLGYLFSRYKDDANAMVTDFITAVIDVISNALARNEPPSTLFLLRSFLCNKVPLIITKISPSSLTSSYAISQAFLKTDVATLMNLSPSIFDPYLYDQNNQDMMFGGDMPVDLRQDFLFACALHGVIGEQDIQGILGELPLGAMSGSGRYDSQEIFNQYLADQSRVEKMLQELEEYEGNSGAVARALFDVMKNLCDSRETLTLGNICVCLARKPSSIDVMLLFIKPAEILEPLCGLLDTWRHEEDQELGEYQPVYEEFGQILLLVITLIKRYSFTSADLAFSHPQNNDSFVPQLMMNYSTAVRIESLPSSDLNAQLGGWIKELYENEGISAGLMSSCRPQEFYRLVPTLFSQSLLAITRGVLELESSKEAFAFLLTPFLLPSVISGLSYLTKYLWANLDSPHAALQLLSSLIIAQGLAPETAESHRTVVSIAARDLDAVLRNVLKRSSNQEARHTANQILATIKPLLSFNRNATASVDEISAWAHSAESGGIAGALANTFRTMTGWVHGPLGGVYTRRLLGCAYRLLGARRMAEIVIAEVQRARAAGLVAGVAEDVAVAMVCAFVPDEGRGSLGIYEALKGMEDGDGGEVAAEITCRVDAVRVPYVPVNVAVDMGESNVDLGAMIGDGMDLMMEGDGFGMEMEMDVGLGM